jgi:type IV pilus assembly protein PilN
MAKINLLPWRAERRKQRQQEFLTMLGVAGAVGALISILIVMYYVGQIKGQTNRNTYLTEQISLLDKQIAEIAELDKKKAGLLRRKQVIEELQASRSQMVHLFDELARTIADGTQVTSLAQNGNDLTLLGPGAVERAGQLVHAQPRGQRLDGKPAARHHRIARIRSRPAERVLAEVTLKSPDDKPPARRGRRPADAAPLPDGAAAPPRRGRRARHRRRPGAAAAPAPCRHSTSQPAPAAGGTP